MFQTLLGMLSDTKSETAHKFRELHNGGGFAAVSPLLEAVSRAISEHRVDRFETGDPNAAKRFLDGSLQKFGFAGVRAELARISLREGLSTSSAEAEEQAKAYLNVIEGALLVKAAKHFRLEPFPDSTLH